MKKSSFYKFLIFRFTTISLTALLFFLPHTVHALETSTPKNSENIQVFLDGFSLKFDVPPVIKEGRTLVPFRVIAESLHLDVLWEDTTQTIKATTPTTSLLLKIGNNTALVNGQAVPLDVPPEITDGRTLIPLRFFSENLGCTVDWLAEQYIIKINSPPQKMLVSGFYALGGGTTSSWKNLFNKDFPETEQGHTHLVKEIALGWYSLDENGNLLTKSTTGWQRPTGWEKVLEAANKYQIKTEMVVHMTDKEAKLSKLITDPIATNQAIANISKEAPLYDGVNLDLEGLGWRESGEMLEQTRANFTRLVKMLYKKLTAQGLTLTLTLHAPNSAYPGYDYESLGNNCDAIIIMAYDYGSKPEPLELVSTAVEKTATLVPAEKLILGISIPSETPPSLPAKIGIAKRYQLKGIALWRLGLVSQEMWQVLHENILPLTVN
jgi:hypothetical protein